MKFLEFFTKPFIWCAIISVTLTAFTVFVLLDTFVLEETYVVVPDESITEFSTKSSVSSSSSSESSKDSSDSSSVSNSGNTTPTGTQESDPYADFDSYYGGDVRIKLTRIRRYKTEVYLAEIVISDVSYLKSAFAENTFGRNIKAETSVMAEEHDAILAMNGDFYGAHKRGYVFRNGTLYQSTIRRDREEDDLLIYKDGSFGYINEETTRASTLAVSNVWHLLRFGPVLLDEGEITVDEYSGRRKAKKPSPRTALGIFEPLHYLFVVSDGRTDASPGLSLYELAKVMKEAGVTSAYNLDGGGSSVIYYNGLVVNNPTDGKSEGERRVSDIVYIG